MRACLWVGLAGVLLFGCSDDWNSDDDDATGDDDAVGDDDDTAGDDDAFEDGYPKLNVMMWGGGSPAWYAEFDWVIAANTSGAAEAKAFNPDLLFSSTLDFNQLPSATDTPDEWKVRNADGDPIEGYTGSHLGDTTDYCGLYQGQTYREWIVEWALDQDWDVLDGINSDGLWGEINWLEPIDADRDGDHDSTDDDVWRDGRLALFAELRAALGEDRLITAWAGHTETYWDQGGENLNGVGAEKLHQYSSWPGFFEDYAYWAEHGREPLAFYVNNTHVGDPSEGSESRENFRFMRYGLAATLLHDGYYGYEDGDGAEPGIANPEHTWYRYYDEYDVPLGQPLGPFVEIATEVFCRFFQGGAMILNASTGDFEVTEDDLRTAAESQGLVWDDVAGEGGHFYRFSGQQDPTYNDGSLFTAIELPSEETWAGYEGPTRRGDGILLVEQPDQVVVAAVIIDHMTFATSPSAENAVLDGFDGTCGEWNAIVGFRTGYDHCTDVNPYHGYTESDAGDGATATFSASLVHEGLYRVYEYHPLMDAYDVPYTVIHADGQEAFQVDQRVDDEQWNLLGTYRFTPQAPAQVIVTDMAAGGTVAADAIRFEWAG